MRRLGWPMDMRLPMRWIAILAGRVRASIAATRGIHRATDAIKMLMVGADVTMLCSVLLRRGIDHLRVIEREMGAWLEEHEYESVSQLKGSLSGIRAWSRPCKKRAIRQALDLPAGRSAKASAWPRKLPHVLS